MRRAETGIDIPLAPLDAGGSPQKTLSPLRIENLEPTRRGAWQKRKGRAKSASTYAATALLPDGARAILTGSQHVGKTYTSSTDQAVDIVGTPASWLPTSVTAVSLSARDNGCLEACDGGLWLAEMTDQYLNVYLKDGLSLLSRTYVRAYPGVSKFVKLATKTVLLVDVSGTLYHYSIAANGTVSAGTSIKTIATSSYQYMDACAVGSDVVCVHADSSNNLYGVKFPSGNASGWTHGTYASSASTVYSVACWPTTGNEFAVAFTTTSGGNDYVKLCYADTTWSATLSVVTVDSWTTASYDHPVSLAGIYRIGQDTDLATYYRASTVLVTRRTPTGGLTDTPPMIRSYVVGDSTGSSGTGHVFPGGTRTLIQRGMSLTKPVASPVDSNAFWFGVFNNTWGGDIVDKPYHQALCTLHTETGQIFSTALPVVARPCSVNVPSALSLTDDGYAFAINRAIDSVNETLASAGLETKSSTLSYTAVVDRPVSLKATSLLIAGGLPSEIDGFSHYEQGWLQKPDPIVVATSGNTGNLTVGTTYSWCCTYVYYDSHGRRHESAPSVAVTYTPTAANETAPNVTIPTPITNRWLTTVAGANAPVHVYFYRTSGTGSDFYLDQTLAIPPTAQTATRQCGVNTDVQILTREPLYTNDGTLEAVAPQPHNACCVHKERVYIAPSETPGVVYYSRKDSPTRGIAHNDGFSIEMPVDTQAITALVSLGDQLVAFTSKRIVVVAGDGLDDDGTGTQPIVYTLADGVGCANSASIVRSPQGCYFLSSDGVLTLLTTGLQLSPVGEPVKHYVDTYETFSSACYDHTRDCVVFVPTGASLLLCHYEKRGAWVTETTADAVLDACALSSGLHILDDQGRIWYASSSYKDDGVYVPSVIETGWLSASEGGWQRLYRMLLTADYVDPASLAVSIAYDMSPVWTALTAYDPTTNLAVFDWGEHFVSTNGTSTNADKQCVLSIQPDRSKCNSFRVRIADAAHASTSTGAGFSYVSLKAFVAPQPGQAQLRTQNRIGA